MSFSIEIDYRFDSTGFFDDPQARAAMEEAAAIWESLILDEFEDVPAGIRFDINNPSDRENVITVTLDQPIDDLIVFVGADDLGATLGAAAPGGRTLDGMGLGDAFERRVSAQFRDQGVVSDYEPWAGWIVFNTDADWNFDLAGPMPDRNDFLTTAVHEIGHILGISTSGIFARLSQTGALRSPNVVEVAGAIGLPVDQTGHVRDGFRDDVILMDPFTVRGTRKMPTEYDLAMLADIGYEIEGFVKQGSQPEIATEGDDHTIFGTQLDDTIDGLGGNDQIQGGSGNDRLAGGTGNDSVIGGAGDDWLTGNAGDDILDGGGGSDTLNGGPGASILFGGIDADLFLFSPGDGMGTIGDFEPGSDTVAVSPDFGFASAEALLAAATKPFANVTRFDLGDGTVIDVQHPAQSGTPLTAADFLIADFVPMPVIRGTPGDDIGLVGTPGDERIEALAGDDVILGSAGRDRIEGGSGTDRVIYDGGRTDYRPELIAEGTVTLAKPGGTSDTLFGVERIDLVGGDYLYDLDGAEVAPVYRLYAAAFDRVPGESGLRFWFGQIEGGTTLRQAALRFIDNPEFDLRYGENPTDEEFVLALYDNALKRAPAAEGLAFWLAAFGSGARDRADMLLAFAGSPENIARTAPDLDDGVWVIAPEFDAALLA